ncbi:MAG: hypothetical protein QNJ34_17755 [Xenococcaceae cyanobacterium MO_188.B29]|nr:hypothetical protein [Xenococcaceae cyanobacterium MO_188.B29]
MFTQIGFTETEAKVRAQTSYSVRLDWFLLASHKSSERLAEIRLLQALLTQQHSEPEYHLSNISFLLDRTFHVNLKDKTR